MGIQARQVVQFAQKNGIRISRRGSSIALNKEEVHCALGVIAHMTNTSIPRWGAAGLSMSQMQDIEAGFEGWLDASQKRNRYMKIGENIARLAGVEND